jgi:methylmalonyl-CoA mutase
LTGGLTPTTSDDERLHRPRRPVRVVTAASLFDGHDAAINIMRRILQSQPQSRGDTSPPHGDYR